MRLASGAWLYEHRPGLAWALAFYFSVLDKCNYYDNEVINQLFWKRGEYS